MSMQKGIGEMELGGKIAVVTGPAKGMGETITTMLASEGADIVLTGRDVEAIAPVEKAVKATGRRAITVPCDIVDPAAVDGLREAAATLGPVDILVNIAGGRGPIGKSGIETTPREFDEIMRLNVNGAFLLMQAFAPQMIERRQGKMINIGGTFGMRGRAGRVSYSASKWGMRGLTKSFALELGPYNINVNTVSPGMVDGPRFEVVCSDMSKKLGISLEKAKAKHAEDYALRRISTAEDVANAVVFLASEKARQITGQDIVVDGGWVI